MLDTLLSKTKKYTQITKEFSSEKIIFKRLLSKFAADTNSSLIFVDGNGNFIFEQILDGHFSLDNEMNAEFKMVDSQLNEQLRNIVEIKTDLNSDLLFIKTADKDIVSKFNFTVSPLSVLTQRIGTVILYRTSGAFSEEELILLEFVTSLIAISYIHVKNEESADESRKINIVKSAIGTLSYSELEAIIHIFNELEGEEGLLIASKIADKVGITRSVIVNALRKFESAGVIESRSLGMKGTYIKVLNEFLMEEIDKLRK